MNSDAVRRHEEIALLEPQLGSLTACIDMVGMISKSIRHLHLPRHVPNKFRITSTRMSLVRFVSFAPALEQGAIFQKPLA